MGNRRKSREYALQLLFQHEFLEQPRGENLFWESKKVDSETRDFAEFLHDHFLENQSFIDRLIRKHAQHWRLERMATVDRNILRMAIAEFLYAETPVVVVIDEAIEVARKYSGEESTEFVNGILDAIHLDLEETAENAGNQKDG